jgi:hypothetical protein
MIKVLAEPIMARAIDALGKALARTKPGVTLSSAGYVRDPSENLLDDIAVKANKIVSQLADALPGGLDFGWMANSFASRCSGLIPGVHQPSKKK